MHEAFSSKEHLQDSNGTNHQACKEKLPQAHVHHLDLLLDGPVCEPHAIINYKRPMDYLKLNPLHDVAKTDDLTKKQFANVMSQALFGRQAVDLLEERKKNKNRLKYAGIGIKRKLDLCQDLRDKAEKLDNVLMQNEVLHNTISEFGAALLHKPRVEEEGQSLAEQHDSLAVQAGRLEAANSRRREANRLLGRELAQLADQVRREREAPGSLGKAYLDKAAREHARRHAETEAAIEALRLRKDEALEALHSEAGLPLRRLLEAAPEASHTAARARLEDLLRERQRDFLEFKDTVDSAHAKVSLQVARLKDDLAHKWQTEVEFLARRIEDHKEKLSLLNSDIIELGREVVHRKASVQEGRHRLSELTTSAKSNQEQTSEDKAPSSARRRKKLDLFVDYLADIFAKLKTELDELWEASGRQRIPHAFGKNLVLLMDYINEITSNLDNYKL